MISTIVTITELRERIARERQSGKRIALVPTMGALHQGHGRLIEQARRESDVLVVSVFVNPLQFGPAEDYARYPRPFEADREFCRTRGVDIVFRPEISGLYPGEQKAFVEVEDVTRELCGRFRPGHFRGVATVVLKLFNIVQPDAAYFGEKDAQQLKTIERMVADLNVPVRIVPVATVREEDGLAMSSRNRYLNPEQRRAAASLYQALRAGYEAIAGGERDPSRVVAIARAVLARQPLVAPEYLEVVDDQSMLPVSCIAGPVRLMAAVWIDHTRLIDNLHWKGE